MRTLSQALAERCSDRWHDRFTAAEADALRDIVRTACVDTVACILAGRDDPATRKLLHWATQHTPQAASSRLLFGTHRALAPQAALVNGVAGHALDYDDVGLAGHPSVVLVPALMAEHDRTGFAGKDLCEAYAKGYAVWADLQRRLHCSLHAQGWHPTAIFGTLAVAAAIASARRLDARQTSHALGIAASLTSGVVANFGSMTKPLHIGRAAEAGMLAVEFAQMGVDASSDALDGPAGLLAALVGLDHVDLQSPLPESFESTLLRQRPGIKKYPVCYAAHRVADGVLDLCQAHDLRIEDIASVDATISSTTAGVLRHHRPTRLTEARFSLEFVVATALLHRRVGLREVSHATLADPAVRRLMTDVRIHTTDTSCPLEPSFALTDEVSLQLQDGRTLSSGPIRFARGHAERPLNESQLKEKLMGCVPVHETALAQALLAWVDTTLT
jgi:aconitate decarboxylase